MLSEVIDQIWSWPCLIIDITQDLCWPGCLQAEAMEGLYFYDGIATATKWQISGWCLFKNKHQLKVWAGELAKCDQFFHLFTELWTNDQKQIPIDDLHKTPEQMNIIT